MPELREDPITGRWVIISIERGKRPSDFISPSTKRKKAGFCPFCPGNELTTPDEIMGFSANERDTHSRWSLRVVPNKFPALQIDGELNKRNEGVFNIMNGIGTHEVIIETPDHTLSLATMSVKAVEDVMWAYYSRLTDLKKDQRFKYIHIFKNEGEAAGASLEHTHSQLIALPIVPKRVQEELTSSKEHYNNTGKCIFCDVLTQEIAYGKRVITENDHYTAIAPYAPRVPFETWILPKEHQSAFRPQNNDFFHLANTLQSVLKKLDKILDIPPYNLLVHTSPFSNEDNAYYHWHMEIIPKLTRQAGFEWGSGFYINPTSPEDAAKFMREEQKEAESQSVTT